MSENRPKSLRELEFVENLVKLMDAHPDFDDIKQAPRHKSGRVVFRPDITCRYQGRSLLVEAKGLGPVIESTVNKSVDQILFYKKAIPTIERAVLAIPNSLQHSYKDQTVEKGIEIWDLDVLAKLFFNQLKVIRDSYLHEILIKQKPFSKSQKLITRLKETPKGRNYWSEYQKLIANIFENLFSPPLSKPIYEHSDAEGINRRDIILPNYCEEGFWKYLREKYMADYLVIDAKNYTRGITKPSVLQVSNYLKEFGAGLFGIICSRTEPKRNAILTQKEQWLLHRKLIIFLDDDDIIQMLIMKDNDEPSENVIMQKIEVFRLGI